MNFSIWKKKLGKINLNFTYSREFDRCQSFVPRVILFKWSLMEYSLTIDRNCDTILYIYTHTHTIPCTRHNLILVHRYYAVRLLRAFVLDYSLDRYNFDSPSSLSILPQPGNTVIRLFATDWRFSNWGSNRWRVNRKRQFPRHRISCIVNGRGSHDERGRSVVESVSKVSWKPTKNRGSRVNVEVGERGTLRDDE